MLLRVAGKNLLYCLERTPSCQEDAQLTVAWINSANSRDECWHIWAAAEDGH